MIEPGNVVECKRCGARHRHKNIQYAFRQLQRTLKGMQLPTLADLGLAVHITAPPTTITIPVRASLRPPASYANRRNTTQNELQRPGNLCKKEGCNKIEQTKGLCRKHGGQSRCSVVNCFKNNKGGGFCRAHGGGKRCSIDDCNKGSQRYGFCHAHGGTPICSVPECTRSDRGSGFCIRHQKEQNARSSHAR